MSENLFGLTVAADPARKHGTYDPQISGADRGCGAVQDPYGSAPTENEVFGKVIEMAKARENIEYKSLDFTRCFPFLSAHSISKNFPDTMVIEKSQEI